MHNIVFIGYRGCGKTTISKFISKKMEKKYYSSDQQIETLINCTIKKYISQHSWQDFRQIESMVCASLAKKKNAVIDLGGGCIEKKENLGYFNQTKNCVVWIDAPLESIYSRLSKEKYRPSLLFSSNTISDQELLLEIKEKLSRRNPLYKKYAHYKITNDGNISSVEKKILMLLKKISFPCT